MVRTLRLLWKTTGPLWAVAGLPAEIISQARSTGAITIAPRCARGVETSRALRISCIRDPPLRQRYRSRPRCGPGQIQRDLMNAGAKRLAKRMPEPIPVAGTGCRCELQQWELP